MGCIQACRKLLQDRSGIALFMVVGAMTVLSILVTEFTYISQVNQKMAYDKLDQVKAHYLAKSAFKLSLLRLKAYQNVKKLIGNATGENAAAASVIPKGMINQIWNFPLIYPFPTELPGLTPLDKEKIKKFVDDSGLQGSFSALISSESSKYNLNLLLRRFTPKKESPSPSPTTSPSPSPSPTSTSTPTPSPSATDQTDSFDPETVRKSLADYMFQILKNKFEEDEDFADEYRDFKLEDLLNNIFEWVDYTYESENPIDDEKVTRKRAPFFSMTELHMLPFMDEKLYKLYKDHLTVATTPGINANTIKEQTLKALIPDITEEELKDFYEFRDSTEKDNSFKKPEDFFNYLKSNVAIFSNDDDEIKSFKENLEKGNIKIVTDESQFKIEIRAQVNQAIKYLDATVALSESNKKGKTEESSQGGNQSQKAFNPNISGTGAAKTNAGLKVTFFRLI